MHKSKTILGMSREDRRRLRLRSKKRRYRRRKVRLYLSDDEMIEYLRQSGFRTMKLLGEGRSKEDPNEYDYKKRFGRWRVAKEMAFGKDIETSYDQYYMVAVIVFYNLWGWNLYFDFRRKHPDLVPSMYAIRKEFGSWVNAKIVARRSSVKHAYSEYFDLAVKLGRKPRVHECEKIGIDASKAMEIYGSGLIYSIVTNMESIREK